MASSVSKPKQFIMAGDEVERMNSRLNHNDIFEQVQQAKHDFGNRDKKVKHAMYLHSVGKIPDFKKLPYSTQYISEMVEDYLEHTCLYQNASQLMEKRHNFAVIEDDFGPALEQMMRAGKKPSYENLIEACRAHDKEENEVEIHRVKSNATYPYFTERGVCQDDARAYACAIAFYTGAYSAKLSMEANIISRRLKTTQEFDSKDGTVDSDAAMIMYYLIKGLSHIDFYWGVVVRYVKLDDKDLKVYQPGEVITWLQFSSADKGGKDMSHFKGRNAVFTIFSLTGRSIQHFSNCGDAEDEVLFLPHSSFLVCDVEYDKNVRQSRISLRQVRSSFSDRR